MEKALAAWLLLAVGTTSSLPATPARPAKAVEVRAVRASERLRELGLIRPDPAHARAAARRGELAAPSGR